MENVSHSRTNVGFAAECVVGSNNSLLLWTGTPHPALSSSTRSKTALAPTCASSIKPPTRPPRAPACRGFAGGGRRAGYRRATENRLWILTLSVELYQCRRPCGGLRSDPSSTVPTRNGNSRSRTNSSAAIPHPGEYLMEPAESAPGVRFTPHGRSSEVISQNTACLPAHRLQLG